MRRRLGFLALGLAAIVAAAMILAVLAAGPMLSRLAEERLAAATGLSWRVSGSPGIAVEPSLTLVVRDLTARAALERGAEIRLDAPTVRVSGTLGEWRSARRLRRIELDGPVLVAPAEWWRFAPPAPATTDVPDVTVDGLVVRNGAVRLAGEGAPATGPGAIDVEAIRDPRGTFVLKASLRLGAEQVRVDATLGAEEPGIGGGRPLLFGLRSPGLPAGALEGTAHVSREGARVTLARLVGAAGGSRFTGAALVDLEAKPMVRLDLAFPSLVLPRGIDAPALDAGTADMLRLFDGRASVFAASLDASGLRLTEVAADLRLTNGALAATLHRASAYDGQIKGSWSVVPASAVHAVTAEVTDARMRPLLADLAGFTLLDGRGSGSVTLNGAGRSVGEVLRSLTGQATIDMRDGRLETIDLPALPRLLASQLPAMSERRDADRTAFDRLAAHFRILDGRAATQDVTLEGPLVTATGAGVIDLPAGTIDMRIESRLVATGGVAKGLDLTVPVMIEGPLDAPRVRPDLAGVAAQGLPGLDALGGLLADPKGLGKGLDGLLDGLLQGGPGPRRRP